jgi:hypothetical protein
MSEVRFSASALITQGQAAEYAEYFIYKDPYGRLGAERWQRQVMNGAQVEQSELLLMSQPWR